jgi:hypothetical protein
MPTVDLRFMVYDADKIKKATGYMLELNAASKDRVVAHDKEGHAMKRAMTATERYNKLSIKLLKIRTKDAEQGHMTAKQLDDQFERHQRILKATESTLKDYIQTDRVAITQEKRKQKLIADSTKATVKYNNETDRLRDKYDSLGAAEKRYLQGKKDIKRAFLGVEDGSNKARRAMDALTAEYEEFRRAHESGTIVNAGNQFARYGDQAYRAQQRTKRFASVGLQQAGYQVNDFIVQVASGQNALVAFGQQGSQLAGIFGTGGAVVGALIAGATAIGNIIYQSYKATNDLRTFEEVTGELTSSIDALAESQEVLDPEELAEKYGSAAESMSRMAFSVRDLSSAIAGADFKASLKAFQEEAEVGIGTFVGKELYDTIFNKILNVDGMYEVLAPLIEQHGANIAGVFAPNMVKGFAAASEEMQIDGSLKISELLSKKVGPLDVQAFYKQLAEAEKTGTVQQAIDTIAAFEARIHELTDGYRELTIGGHRYTGQLQAMREQYASLIKSMETEDKGPDDKAEKRIATALDNLTLLSQGMDLKANALNAREKLLAKQTIEMNRETLKLQRAGADLSDEQVAAALDELDAAHEAQIVEFDRLQAEKERAKVAKQYAQALQQEQDILNRTFDQQAKVFNSESDSLDIQREKNALLLTEVLHGKESDTYSEKAIETAGKIVELKLRQKFLAGGITEEEEELIVNAMQVAQEGVSFAQSLEEAKEHAKGVNAEISKMQGLIDKLFNFGTSIEKRVNKARAQTKALLRGEDLGTAGTIADLRFEAGDQLEKARLQSLKLREGQSSAALATANKFYEDSVESINTLERLLKAMDRKKAEGKTGGGKTPKSALDILLKEERSMKLKLDQREALIGLTDQEILRENVKYALMSKVQEQMVTMDESQKAATLARIDGIAQEMAAREEQLIMLDKIKKFNEDVAQAIGSTFESNFMSIVDGTKSVADAFKAMAADIVAHLFKVLVVQSAIRNMGGMMAMAGGPMGAIGGALMSYGSADGNVFNNGNAVPYADGGVVNVPTYFPMNDGRTGLMGEAGPEAIMPLRRGKNGKLGVQVEGGRGDVIIHQSFNFQANGDESVKKIIAQQAPAIANMTKSKILEDRRRGGQTRQAFG